MKEVVEFINKYTEFLKLYINTGNDKYLFNAYNELSPLLKDLTISATELVEIHNMQLKDILHIKSDGDSVQWYILQRSLEFLIQILLTFDIESEEQEENLYKDSLTKLYNRRFFNKIFDLTFYAQKYYSILFIDIDNFKKINDKFGHDIGDVVLQQLGKIIKKNVRTTDYPCRYGGEELVVLLPSSNYRHSIVIAEKILNEIRKHDFLEVGKVTVSIGIAEKHEDGAKTPEELLKFADMALYSAKNSGKDKAIPFYQFKKLSEKEAT